MMVDLKEIQKQSTSRLPILQAPARNLFLAVWQKIGANPKAKMVTRTNMVKQDGPTLLWKLLTEYHNTAAQSIRY